LPRLLLIITLFFSQSSYGQCSTQSGPPPAASTFSSGTEGLRDHDSQWMVCQDSANGNYLPALLMRSLPSGFYNPANWISVSSTGEHAGDRYYFFRKDFELPCTNQCNKSYDEDYAYCLNLNLYADNSIYEIYVNGIPQSDALSSLIRYADPFNPGAGQTQSTRTAVSLCKDWQPGSNTLIIQIASSATIAGINVEGVEVKPVEQTLKKEICAGESYLGHTTTGKYLEKYIGLNGCDSTRIFDLVVHESVAADFGHVPPICDGDSLVLNPGDFLSYAWNDGSVGKSLTVRTPGTYSVTVSDGCATKRITAVIQKGACGISFPNVFTANGDGKNDVFKIATDLKVDHYLMQVFTRWGQRVFLSNVLSEAWDGRSKGVLLPQGVYIWKCVLTRANVTSYYRGSVILLR
jgi:gliding motility-associated-like protein